MSLKLDAIGGEEITADAFEEGRFLHLQDDDGNDRFFKDDPEKPIGVTVRSVRSKPVEAADLKIQRKRTTMNRGSRRQNATVPTKEFIAHQAAAAVVTLHWFSAEAPEQKPTEAELYAMFMKPQWGWLADDIWAFAQEDKNFLGEDPGVGSKTIAPPISQDSLTVS